MNQRTIDVGQIVIRKESAMGNKHWTDYIILAFAIGAAGCLSAIQIRKTFKFGPVKGLVQDMDGFDKKLSKIAGLLFLTFLIFLVIRLMVLGEYLPL